LRDKLSGPFDRTAQLFAPRGNVVTHPQTVRFRLVRAFAAMIVVLGVLLAPMEQMLPVAHVADAPVAEQARIDHSGSQVVGGAIADVNNLPGDHQELPPQSPIHATHVDHCAHGHLLTLAGVAGAGADRAAPPDAYDLSSQRLASISLPPHKRPPIA
jgi:hypothetical protein